MISKSPRNAKEALWRETQSQYDDSYFLSRVAGKLDLLRWDLLEQEAARALRGIKGRLLDAGAGTGKFRRLLEGTGLSYFALEPSPNMIAKAEASVLPSFVRGRNEELPFKDGAFKAILVKETLDHCFDPALVLLEAKRALARGGTFVLTFHNAHAYYRLLFGWLKADDEEHLFHFYPARLKDMLTAAGMRVKTVRCHNYLRLPKVLENLMCSLFGRRLMMLALRACDALGRRVLPGLGGGVIVVATKVGTGETAKRRRGDQRPATSD